MPRLAGSFGSMAKCTRPITRSCVPAIVSASHLDADDLSGCGISDCQQTDEERR